MSQVEHQGVMLIISTVQDVLSGRDFCGKFATRSGTERVEAALKHQPLPPPAEADTNLHNFGIWVIFSEKHGLTESLPDFLTPPFPPNHKFLQENLRTLLIFFTAPLLRRGSKRERKRPKTLLQGSGMAKVPNSEATMRFCWLFLR